MAADLATAIYEQSLKLPRSPRPTLYIRITLAGGMHDRYSFLLEMQYEAARILVTEHGFSKDHNTELFWSTEGSGRRKLSFRMNACTPAICKYVNHLQRYLDLSSELDEGLEGLALTLVEAPPSKTIMTQKYNVDWTQESWSKLVVPKAFKRIRIKTIEEIKTECEVTGQLTDLLVSWIELGAMYQPSTAHPQC